MNYDDLSLLEKRLSWARRLCAVVSFSVFGSAVATAQAVTVAELVASEAASNSTNEAPSVVRPMEVGQELFDPSLDAADFGSEPVTPELRPAVKVVEPETRSLRERIFSGDGWSDQSQVSRRFKAGADVSRVRFELDTDVVADDNIFFEGAGEETSDVIFRFRPGAFFSLGEEGSGASAFVEAAYRPTASVFMDNDSENSVDHDVSLRIGGGGEKLSTSIDTAYRTLSEASVDVGQRTDRQVIAADVAMDYAIGGKTGVRAELGYERADYDVFAGFDEWRADVYATYAVGVKTNIGLGFGTGQLRPDKQRAQDYQRVLARADWQATAKLAVAAWGGTDLRKGDGGDENTAVFGIELGGDLREGTHISFSAGRDIGASALIETETYTLTRYGVGIEQRLGERFTGAFDVGFENYEYSGGGDLAAGRSDESVFLRPALRYRLRDDLTAEVFYSFRKSDSSIADLDFDNSQFGLSVHYEF